MVVKYPLRKLLLYIVILLAILVYQAAQFLQLPAANAECTAAGAVPRGLGVPR
jgi:hypothetical protein